MNEPVGLGIAIKALRDRRGWTQGQLSLYSQVNQSYLSRIERGKHDQKVSARIIAALAKALDVSTDYLFEEAGLLPLRIRLLKGELIPQERELIEVIRQIPSDHLRERTLEILIGFTMLARDADIARHEEIKDRLRLVAEQPEDYERQEE